MSVTLTLAHFYKLLEKIGKNLFTYKNKVPLVFSKHVNENYTTFSEKKIFQKRFLIFLRNVMSVTWNRSLTDMLIQEFPKRCRAMPSFSFNVTFICLNSGYEK